MATKRDYRRERQDAIAAWQKNPVEPETLDVKGYQVVLLESSLQGQTFYTWRIEGHSAQGEAEDREAAVRLATFVIDNLVGRFVQV